MKFFQRLGRSLMLPVAVLPVAAILSGLGYWISSATGDENNIASVFLTAAGGALLDHLALLFAIGVAIGMAKKSDGTSAMAGLVSWLTITTLLSPATMALFQGVAEDKVNPAYGKVENAFIGILCGLIGAWAYDHFKDTKLPDALSFFSGKRSVAIVTAGISLVVAIVLIFVWPLVYGALVAFGTAILGIGPIGAGLYGFFNRLLIPLGLHHALNSVFWFDVAGINDLTNFQQGKGTYGVTGQYMAGFFPIMMFGLPGAALAMYTTAKTSRKKLAAGILLSAAIASFFVGVTEPLEFSFMFLAPVLFVIHALFMGISMAVTAALPVRMGFGFSGGFIDLLLGWNNPMAQNPWAIPLMGIFWFVVYFLVFRFVILRFHLKTPGREDGDPETDEVTTAGDGSAVSSNDRYVVTGDHFLSALGGPANILELENCATRLRMELDDVSRADEQALKRAGAAGVIKPGGHSYQVIYGLNVQFVKDAMEGLMSGEITAPSPAQEAAIGDAVPDNAASAPTAAETGVTLVRMRQPIAGQVVPLDQVPDQTFASGAIGTGLAIEPTGEMVVAPASGVVTHAFPTGHAVALTLDDGTEVLIHVGLDTVELNGRGLEMLVSTGDRVSAGTPLIRVDLATLRAEGKATITPIVLLNRPGAAIELL